MTMNIRKRIPVFVSIILAAVLLMSGCGKKATPESLMTDINKNLEKVKSVSADVKAEIKVQEAGESFSMQMDMEFDTTDEPAAAYMKGSVSLKQGGSSYGMDMEGYTVEEGDSYVSYNCTENQWVRTVIEDEEEALDENVFEDLVKQHKDFKLSEEEVKIGGKACFEMKGKVKAETLDAFTGADLLESLYSGLDEMETEDEGKITCTIAVYKDDILPARVHIDLEDSYVEITYKEYNKVKEIKVPEEVLEETGAAVSDSGDKKDKDKTDKKDSQSKTVQQDARLGDSWDSYTVQVEDQLLSLPCEIENLEAAGLSLDTEMTPDGYIVNAGEDELVYFRNDQGTSIMVYLVNQTEEPKEIGECIVGGISTGQYSMLGGEVTVIFPGGIQLGTDLDTVMAVYGEADNDYEDENYKTRSWYDEDFSKFNNQCFISFDAETNQVEDMTISCYER